MHDASGRDRKGRESEQEWMQYEGADEANVQADACISKRDGGAGLPAHILTAPAPTA